MSPPHVRELLAHAQALRALARDLVGDGDADDLVQETALQALMTPPRRPGPFGGWLATVLRHLASKHRRGEGRRRRHEQAAARPEIAAPSREAEDCDAFRRLSEAVLCLPEPYRGALLARYLREETPSAIAERTGVPVRTVKTRLARGLALLRERFDGERDDWRAAFASLFGIERALPVAASVAAGVIVMGSGVKLAIGGAAAVLAVAAALFVLDRAPDAAPPAAGVIARGPDAVAGAPGAVTAEETVANAPQRTAAPALASPFGAVATLRGRCVDASGNPVAGVAARLEGSGYLSRLEAWVRDNPEPLQIHQHTTTGADGTFAFTFAPPPPFKFEVELRDLQHVPQRAFWREFAAGANTDVGDVVLPDGARVAGAVVDTSAAMVPSARVTLDRRDPESFTPAFVPVQYYRAVADAAGHFVLPALPVGDYEIAVADRTVTRDRELHIGPDLTPQSLAITVLAKVDGPVIAGVATDPDGRPLGGVFFGTDPILHNGSQVSDKQGHFEIQRREGDPEAAPRICAQRDGYDNWQSRGPVAWGTTDLKVVMRPGVGLELRVTDAVTGSPVENYQVRAWSEESPRDSRMPSPELAGRHPAGVCRVTGLRRGLVGLVVEPLDEHLVASAPQLCEVGEEPTHVDVVLQSSGSRPLRVQLRDGTPVTGSVVQLVEPLGVELDMGSVVLPIEGWGHCTSGNPRQPIKSLLRQEGITDTQGELQLHGPATAPLSLLLRGPGHVPQVVPDVDLSRTEPLVVTVTRGACLEGHATPVAVVAYFRQLFHLPPTGAVPAVVGHIAPKITLARDLGGRREWYPKGNALETRALAILDGDGSYRIDGIPPGTWEVQLQEQWHTTLQTVTLEDGEHRQLDLDLGAYVPGTVNARVLWNGNPAPAADVSFVQKDPVAKPRRNMDRTVSVRTDSEGRLQCQLPPGEWSLQLRHELGEPCRYQMFRSSSLFTVSPGGNCEPILQVLTGTVRIKVLDARGQPVTGVTLSLLDENGAVDDNLPPTGADGTTVWQAESRTFPMATLPKRLLSREAQHAFFAAHPGENDPLNAVRLRLGEVTVPVGQTVELELHLPPEWEH